METSFLQRLFFCFLRMLCIRLAAFRRRARGGGRAAANSQYCNLHLPKGFCVLREGETTIPQALRASSLYTKESFFLFFSHVTAGKCLPNKLRRFRYWVQGRCPCWGLRGRSPSGFPKRQWGIVCQISQEGSATGSRGDAPGGCRGIILHLPQGLPSYGPGAELPFPSPAH